jgi:hypothetical protein
MKRRFEMTKLRRLCLLRGLLLRAELGLDLVDGTPVLVLRDGHAALDADADSFLGWVVFSQQAFQQ